MRFSAFFSSDKSSSRWSGHIRLRMAWILFVGILTLLLLASANELLDIHQETTVLRQTLSTMEVEKARSVVVTLREQVIQNDRQSIRTSFHQLGDLFAKEHLMLVSPDGTVLFDNQIGWTRSPIEASELIPAHSVGAEATWLVKDKILWVTAPIVDDEGRLVAVLINESNVQDAFNQLYLSKTRHAAQFLLVILIIMGIFLLINWALFINPLDHIFHLTKAIRAGEQNLRAPESPVLELQRVNMAFNEMVGYLADQSAALEKLNRSLENTVADRTAALEKSSLAIRDRATQLEAINRLIASTVAAVDIASLARGALDQALRMTGVEMGSIWVRGYRTSIGLPMDTGSLNQQRGFQNPANPFEKLQVNDWSSVTPADPQYATAEGAQTHHIRSTNSFPILAENAPIGRMTLNSARPHRWSPEENVLLEIVSLHLGTAIERIQFIENIRANNAQMRELIAQTERLNQTFSLQEVIATIGEGTLALCQADRLAIFVCDPAQPPACAWSRGLPSEFVNAALEYGQTFTQCINNQTSQEPLLFPDFEVGDNQSPDRQVLIRSGSRSAVIWPLIYENRVNAIVCCFYRQPLQWKQNELEIHQTFFRQAAASLENARLFEAECIQRQLAEALRDAAATLTSTLDLDEVLEGILTHLGRVIPHHAAIIMLIENDMIRPVRFQGIPPLYLHTFQSWCYSVKELSNRQEMINTGEALIIPDINQDKNWVRTIGLEWVNSYAGAPICQRGQTIGFIDMMSAQAGFFNAKTGPILQAFASQAAIAIENARLYHESHQREVDSSTLYRAVQPLFNPIENTDSLAQQITESVTQAFASAHCSILMVDKEWGTLNLVAQSGSLQISAPSLPLDGPGLTVSAVRDGRMIYAPDVHRDENYVCGADLSRSELAIPLFAGREVIGVINFESPEVNAFDERGRQLLLSFAEQAALALENARLFATVRQNAEQMAQLNEVVQRRAQEAENLRFATAALSSSLDLQSVLDSILRHLKQVLAHDSACIFLIEDDTHLCARATSNILSKVSVLERLFPRDDSLLMEVETSLRPVTLIDAQQDPRFKCWGDTNNVHGWMGIPLVANNKFMGTLTLNRIDHMQFTPEEMHIAQAFANQAAVAVQNAGLYYDARQRARELEALHSATTSLVSTLDLQKLLERIVDSASSAIPATQMAVLHLNDEHGALQPKVQQGWQASGETVPDWNCPNSPWSWAAQHRSPILMGCKSELNHGIEDECLPIAWDNHSLLIAPLVQEDRLLGLISLISPKTHAFNDQDLHLLISFANTATAAIHNAQLHSEVQYLAVIDPLTAVYNRRGFYRLAENLVEQPHPACWQLSAIMIDIDFFKQINDRFGHDVGDIVLRMLADRCRKALRETDIICRYGGEEFAILLIDSDASGARLVADRIHQTITELPMETSGGPVSVTVSVGLATTQICGDFTQPGAAVDHLLKCADQALYKAKYAGRNQVQEWIED